MHRRLVGTRRWMMLTPKASPVTSPPPGQKDVQENGCPEGWPGILQPSPLTWPSETFPWTPSVSSGLLSMSCLVPANNTVLSFTKTWCQLIGFAACSPSNKHCTFLHHSLESTDRLCCVSGEWTRVWFHNTFYAQSAWLWMN